jgi:alpha-ketoglutarate-dependent taurine dioxygenase
MTAVLNNCDENSPYFLENEGEYQAWRARKLKVRQEVSASRVFELDKQGRLSRSMLSLLGKQVAAYNFVIFQSVGELDKAEFLALNRQFGLTELDANLGADEDRVTSLQVVGDADSRAQYIPYTNRAMNWHTDGYYNPLERRIDAFALYCVNQAGRGGGNYLFDHEMMYLLIRDQSPAALAALMCEDMLRIPANVQQNRVIRAEESGPVFSLQASSCVLNMRYTSRPQNIVWKTDKPSTEALNLVREILVEGSAMVEVHLQPRQGIVCNNILHGREAFQDAPDQPARLIYRARYHDAIDLDKGLGAETLRQD